MSTTVVPPPQAAERKPNYNKVAWFYEFSSRVYSLGQIHRSKQVQAELMQPGQRVLYLGVGSGEDALLAAQAGAEVTCIDLSSSMIKRARRKLERAGLQAEWIVGDVFDYQPERSFDIVAMNYFLNCFSEPRMVDMLRRGAAMVKPFGQLMIADVAHPQGNLLYRAFNQAYLKAAMFSYWALGLVQWHENFDYVSYLEQAGLTHEQTRHFRLLGAGPVVFQNIVARRVDG